MALMLALVATCLAPAAVLGEPCPEGAGAGAGGGADLSSLLAVKSREYGTPAQQSAPVKTPKFATLSEDAIWGVFIDGRDAQYGSLAYGEEYRDTMTTALHGVYDMAKADDGPLTMHHFRKIVQLLDIGWRDYEPRFTDTLKCLPALPKDVSDLVMSDDVKNLTSVPAAEAERYVEGLLEQYNREQERSSIDKVGPLVNLLRRFAWVHPLYDRNGRSRLLLLQLELRRKGIAGGTMRFNNNRNIYVETADMCRKRIEEGISMYDKVAQAGPGWKPNPWLVRAGADSTFYDLHCPSYASALQRCWRSCDHCGSGDMLGLLQVARERPPDAAGHAGTADAGGGAEALAAFDPQFPVGEHASLCSVAGGLDGFSLLPALSGRLSAITFFDRSRTALSQAELLVILLRFSPNRSAFLERRLARRNLGDAAKASTESLRELMKMPFDEDVYGATLRDLDCEASRGAAELYQGDLGSGGGGSDVAALWLGRAGFMKDEESYGRARQVLLSTPVNYREVTLEKTFAARDMGLPDDKAVVMFTSSILASEEGVKAGDVRSWIQKAFPKGGQLLETISPPLGKLSVTRIER